MPFRRMSLLGLLSYVACLAVLIVSLKYASPMWQGLVGLTAMLVAAAALSAALFGRGVRRAFAIGFAATMFCYALLFKFEGPDKLPTTVLLASLYTTMNTSTWVDATTGKAVPEFDMCELIYPTDGLVRASDYCSVGWHAFTAQPGKHVCGTCSRRCCGESMAPTVNRYI